MRKVRSSMLAVLALIGLTGFEGSAFGQQLTITRSVTASGTTWLRLFGDGNSCYDLDQSKAVVASNTIAVHTSDHGAVCFPEPALSFFDTTTDVGRLPDGHYTVTWSFDAPLIWPTTMTEFDVNAAADGVTAQVVTEFSLSPSTDAQAYGITTGSDGNLWVVEPYRRVVARITPLGGVTEFGSGVGIQPWNITAGPDGNLWFSIPGASRIGRITPLGVLTEFNVGVLPMSGSGGVTPGPDGNVWFTKGNDRIGRITPDGVVTEFGAGISAGSHPSGITAGPDGNLWFTEPFGNRIGRITPDGVVTEFTAGITNDGYPGYITAGSDGNLWFTNPSGNRIGRITPVGIVTEFSAGISPGAQPQQITSGPDGNLWFTETFGRIGRITPSGVVTEINAGISGSPSGITAGPDGNLWITEPGLRLVARISTGVPTPTVVAVEYYYAAWDYYFETSFPDEIAALDGGAFGGVWKRTGQTFNVWPQPNVNSSPTCRFFTTAFAPKSSHVYTPFASECASLKAGTDWQYEGIAFYIQQANANGLCTDGTIPLYRLYNNGMGGAPNHRYTTSETILDQMIAAGWIFEGDGNTKVFACVPQ